MITEAEMPTRRVTIHKGMPLPSNHRSSEIPPVPKEPITDYKSCYLPKPENNSVFTPIGI
jgi:hypothetical protein